MKHTLKKSLALFLAVLMLVLCTPLAFADDVVTGDCGDHVIIVNASKIVLTGKKLDQKIYYHHSGYAGGLKETKYRKLIAEKPEFAVRHAIVGMLPKGPLGRQMASKLRIYAGPEHEQAAQKPEVLELIK